MDEEKRSNGGYEIIESCTIGSNELVIGHNPNAPNPYVCWYCKGGDNYFWGYYCNDISAAHIEHRNKLDKQLNTWILPLVFDRLNVSGSIADYAR